MAQLIEWLAGRSPDIWHWVVARWSEWDGDISPLQWIVGQEACDQATAILAFSRNEPDVWMDYPTRDALRAERGKEDFFLRGFDLSFAIITRWNAGFYTRSEIAWDPASTNFGICRKLEAKRDPALLPWKIPEAFFLPIAGKKIEWTAFERELANEGLVLG